MRTPRSRIRLPALFAIFLMASPALSWAHGSVAESKEGCVITFDFYSAHFNVFQPQTRQHTAFCEDLPDVTETLFVLEYLHDSLREVPVEFRILRNTSPLGRFVRWEHLQTMGDLDALTVFRQRAEPQTDGILSVLFPFAEAGDYVGIVSAPNPASQQEYYAVFPFSVGAPWWHSRGWWALALLVLLALPALRRILAARLQTLQGRLA